MPYTPSVLAAMPDLGVLPTTVPFTTKSILLAPTRTSRALVALPLASGCYTAALGVLSTIVSVEGPLRCFTSHVPSSATTKYR